jgi:hypothetical protein
VAPRLVSTCFQSSVRSYHLLLCVRCC